MKETCADVAGGGSYPHLGFVGEEQRAKAGELAWHRPKLVHGSSSCAEGEQTGRGAAAAEGEGVVQGPMEAAAGRRVKDGWCRISHAILAISKIQE